MTGTPFTTKLVLVALVCGSLFGCHTGTYPDPNDPTEVGNLSPEVLRANMKGASDALLERVAKREINGDKYKELIADHANSLLDEVKLEKVSVLDAWKYAEIFITAKRWSDAEQLLRVSLRKPPNEDRRVNDSLRLARVLAEKGQVNESIQLVKKTFSAPGSQKAPILYATLLEIVPAGRGKKHDVELAQLLEEAIAQGKETVVDPKTDAGKMFLEARPIHIRNAWTMVADLYNAAGKYAEADAIRRKAMADASL